MKKVGYLSSGAPVYSDLGSKGLNKISSELLEKLLSRMTTGIVDAEFTEKGIGNVKISLQHPLGTAFVKSVEINK